ncbi:GPI ethanolamine phosphate transferase 3 [Vanrija pseudolonga]|uniref:GPI ethanolamine phosphate transferase 3 n=1 Tax=Vanrija pseudolonga TaxID=143232 RepID=A0AAF1BJ60_9TREE|nr:GPI ethanolamine phosphate transferase 3 [Vanrija pseudolonga]
MAEPTARARTNASSWIAGLSKLSLAALLLTFVTFIHLVGLGVFTHGFLLTRLVIPDVAAPYKQAGDAPLPATHSKAVLIIIDALRTDFISPHHPSPKSDNHHGVLTLPAELTASQPGHSLIFNSFSDPPTTTMQRLKAITTGSLPTFIDAGANFASTAIEEDSLISQLNAANKSVVFMGDDTWLNLFPSSFSQAYPYDSFNVEDLHTVDNGVIEHIFPLLHPDNSTQWDFLIGHFLGVDHVGHRVGPERETMRTKLAQMDTVLRDVVDKLDDDTLLVVLGDHGMTTKGDHGGDSELETSAALWIYSKGKPLAQGASSEFDWPRYTFPGSKESLRHVDQIDLVPTLSLALGLPIPFNNLGSVIPELFSGSLETLETATRVNAEQIARYVKEYDNRDVVWAVDTVTKRSTAGDDLASKITHNRRIAQVALENLRALWAQFSVPHIIAGIVLLALSVAATVALYLGVRNSGPKWDDYVRLALDTAITTGGITSSVVGTVAGVYTRDPAVAIKTFFVSTAAIASLLLALPLVFRDRKTSWRSVTLSQAIGPAVLILHAVSFASNSFVMWEDRMVGFLLVSIVLVSLWRALLAPMASLRLRILLYSLGLAIIARAMGFSTICREEQQPYCRVTFYGPSGGPSDWGLYMAPVAALMFLPRVVAVVLSWSKSYNGPAPFFIAAVWRVLIIVNTLYWVFEWMETWDGLQPDRIPLVKIMKLWIARVSLGASLGLLPHLWYNSGLCIDVVKTADQATGEEEVGVYGFGNSYGSTYLLFLLIIFSVVHLVSASAGQVVLCLVLVAILLYVELIDAQRDSIVMKLQFANSASPGAFDGPSNALVRPSFTDAVPLALLALLAFFTTGHQAVFASIQWKAAFVGFETVTYPWSPALVGLNTIGPLLLVAMAVPLVAIWNVSPRPNQSVPVLAHSVQLALAFITYFATITLASAVTSAWLRRHLMVWKVFAPRFMIAGIILLAVDVALIFAVTVGFGVTSSKVYRTFRSVSE